MPVNLKARPLKVCSTCCHWSYTYKGLCARLNQGVGRFWTCQEWAAADQDSAQVRPGEASGPTAP